MDVRTLCLGVLSLGDASGYEIKKKLEGSFRRFYEAGYGSIYPALERLREAGLVSCVEMLQQGRPDKKVYSLTPEGRRAFVAELCRTPEPDRIRSEFLVAMLFSAMLPGPLIDDFVHRRLADYDESIALLEARLREPLSPGRRFVVGYGLAVYRAGRDYLASNRHLVEKPAAESRGEGSGQAAGGDGKLED